MKVAIDFGISNTDLAILNKEKLIFHTLPSLNKELSDLLIKEILSLHNINISDIGIIGVTGGKSSDLEDMIDSIPVIKVNEIEAIGTGAKHLYQIKDESSLIVSAGTGTACVHVEKNSCNHLGGIAVGGGMLEGLGHMLLNNADGAEINEYGVHGDRSKLDFLIGDVVNKIGALSQDITAVNFGRAKTSSDDAMENTTAALCNMVGEVIGTIAYLNAMLIGSNNAYFVGRTSLLSEVTKGINNRLELAGIKGQYNDQRGFGNVIGVMEIIKNY